MDENDIPIPPPNQLVIYQDEPMLKITKSEAVTLALGFAIGFFLCLFALKTPRSVPAAVRVPAQALDSATLRRIDDGTRAVIIIKSNSNQTLKEYEKAKSDYHATDVVVLP